MTAHNLNAGFYLLDHTTGTVTQGPFGTRNQAVCEYRRENSPGPFVVLEVVGDMVPWMGAAVGNVCVTAETDAACDENGPVATMVLNDDVTPQEWSNLLTGNDEG